jgi:pimeloyl-ACP methyl ester carboxylesterase
MKTSLSKCSLAFIMCAAALLLGDRWCLAQDCPSTNQVDTINSTELALDPQFQPYPIGTPPPLHCYRFAPPAPYDPPYPTVLMVPANVWRDDQITDEGDQGERRASYDLQQQGFLVFQVETRLAPPGQLPNQLETDKGYAPEQTDDLKRQILSALADQDCNKNIYLVGGSAGGCLALWCALDPASTVSGWTDTYGRGNVKAVVSLSGPSQLCDWMNPGNIPESALGNFECAAVNYVGLPCTYSIEAPCDPNCDWVAPCPLDQASPAWLVTHGATSNPPPVMLYATDGDPVPNQQATDMWRALTTQFPSLYVRLWIMKYTYGTVFDHAYKYWHAKNNIMGSDSECVSEEVITFLKAH